MLLKSVNLRIEQDLFEKTKSIASKEKQSFNNFVQNLIIEKLKEKEKQELFDEFSIVGEDDSSDIEYAITAQKEVILNERAQYFELWYIDWNPSRGSKQAGIRTALIIQNDVANHNDKYPNTIVLAVSTKGKLVSFHIELKPSLINGLKEVSYVKCEQIMTISKDRLLNRIGLVENDYKLKIDKALTKTLNIG